MGIYNIFDTFLDIDTWHTEHPYDIQRFNRALAYVVQQPNFSPEEMGHYLAEKLQIPYPANDQQAVAVQKLVHRAWAVKEYFDSTYNMAAD